MFLSIVLLGAIHGLIWLPVFLSYIGPLNPKSVEYLKHSTQNQQQNNNIKKNNNTSSPLINNLGDNAGNGLNIIEEENQEDFSSTARQSQNSNSKNTQNEIQSSSDQPDNDHDNDHDHDNDRDQTSEDQFLMANTSNNRETTTDSSHNALQNNVTSQDEQLLVNTSSETD